VDVGHDADQRRVRGEMQVNAVSANVIVSSVADTFGDGGIGVGMIPSALGRVPPAARLTLLKNLSDHRVRSSATVTVGHAQNLSVLAFSERLP
jgi:hypothetical protein